MDNETKLSSEQINSIMAEAKKQSVEGKVNAEELMKKHLNEEQAEKVRSILKDPEKLRQLLQSPMAQKFMNSMKEKQDKG